LGLAGTTCVHDRCNNYRGYGISPSHHLQRKKIPGQPATNAVAKVEAEGVGQVYRSRWA